jgi:hypothetical protein
MIAVALALIAGQANGVTHLDCRISANVRWDISLNENQGIARLIYRFSEDDPNDPWVRYRVLNNGEAETFHATFTGGSVSFSERDQRGGSTRYLIDRRNLSIVREVIEPSISATPIVTRGRCALIRPRDRAF